MKSTNILDKFNSNQEQNEVEITTSGIRVIKYNKNLVRKGLESMKSKHQLYMEACDYLDRKIETLYKEIERLNTEIVETEKLRDKLETIYE